MPVIRIYSPHERPKKASLLKDISDAVTDTLQIPSNNCWILWIQVNQFYKEDWLDNSYPAPVLQMICKDVHSQEKIQSLLPRVKEIISFQEECLESNIFISVQKLERSNLLIRNEVWI